MSAIGSGEAGFSKILLRSSTPAPNEKVLKYLEGMHRDSVSMTPPASMAALGDDYQESLLKSPGSRKSRPNKSSRHEDAKSDMTYGQQKSAVGGGGDIHTIDEGDEDDIKSNTQDGMRSELMEDEPKHEPGPNDPPGPHYESYDSGPSFGNFGPLPTDENPSAHPFTAGNTWQPMWIHPSGTGQPVQAQATGRTLDHAANLALPESVASPRATSVLIGVESPSSPRSKSRKTPSKSSHRSPSVLSDEDNGTTTQVPMSPTSRNHTKVASERVMSPSLTKSPPLRTEKMIAYPALPESAAEDGLTSIGSPTIGKTHKTKTRTRASTKAPSVSPSDSPSQPPKPHKSRKATKSEVAGESSPSGQAQQIPASVPARSPPPGSVFSGTHQDRPFSPYRHAATAEDLVHAAVRGRAFMPEPQSPEKAPTEITVKSPVPVVNDQSTKEPSVASPRPTKEPSLVGSPRPSKQASVVSKSPSAGPAPVRKTRSVASKAAESDVTPRASPRPPSPPVLNADEERMVNDTLRRKSAQTPRTSMYAPSSLGPDEVDSHFHDMDLCVLLHQENDSGVHEVVKRALRKAIRQRVKKLGMKHDNESIKQYRRSFHNHDPSVHLNPNFTPSVTEEPPEWAKELIQGMVVMQQRIEGLGPKIEELKYPQNRDQGDGNRFNALDFDDGGDNYTQSPTTQTVNIRTHLTGTMADSMYQIPETEGQSQLDGHQQHDEDEDEEDGGLEDDFEDDGLDVPPHHHQGPLTEDGGETYTRQGQSQYMSETRDDSPGQQYLEEELYKLRQKTGGSQSGQSHRTWEVARDDGTRLEDYDEEDPDHGAGASGLPTIPDTNGGAGAYADRRAASLPPTPQEEQRDLTPTPQQIWRAGNNNSEAAALPPWQKIHQRLLSWAIIWPMSELDNALNSTTRGHQVDEVALSIWTTQTYKRYVRAKMTDSPQGVVDRLFVPPNMADAISSAVFHGRHGDACGMLRDLWSPFGLEGMPRLLVVLAKHRSDPNHWIVHRFSLPDGSLTTYDSYPDRTLHDGRPLGWWFAIRIAWPNAIYPSPDHLLQKMVRLHRPMQLGIDNSVAAAGIWRNILMGSRAERSLDLERLRDLINTEVKNLRQRKLMGKLSINGPRPNINWEDMN